jgi:hypothetical protein
LDVGTIAVAGVVGVDLAAVDELFGDAFVEAEIDLDHKFDGILDSFFLSEKQGTLSSMTKFLIILCRVCLRISVVRMTSF